MSTLPISVFIIAKNEEDIIAQAIASVRGWVDEVIVIDSGSEDATVALAEAAGARVVFHAWEGYGRQKIFGEGLCRHRWLLNLDADEEVSPALAAEIQELFALGPPPVSGYWIDWKILMGQERTPRRFASGNRFIRLYDKEKAGFRDSTVHDSVVVRDGRTGALQGLVWHRNYRSFQHWRGKLERYTAMQAEDLYRKGRCPSALRLVAEPFWTFLKCWLLRRYIVYGVNGFLLSWLYADARLARLAKTRDLFAVRRGRGL